MTNPETDKQKYGVAARYKAVHVGSQRRRHLWEQIIFVIYARDEDDAKVVAEMVAREKEHEYLNEAGEIVHWVLMEIEQVKKISDDMSQNGAEVYCDFFEKVDKKD